jgi:hypothetical protein
MKSKKRQNNKKKYSRKNKYRKKTIKGGASNIFQANKIIDVLNYIKSIGIDNDLTYELCGTIEIVRNRPHKYEVMLHDRPATSTSTSTSRLFCDYENYSNIIWHTHPTTSKFYPSLEDIEKVIKLRNRNVIKDSYIITEFGIWQLSAINYILIADDIRQNIQNILDSLYWKTNRGRNYQENAVNETLNELNMLLDNILETKFFTYPL